jgi:hypothetical protein
MSVYTDAASRPGIKGASGTDDRELFLRTFGEMVLEAYEETFDFKNGKTYVRQITKGKSDLFPIIGRKRDAQDHKPGEIILGGGIEHDETSIEVDNITVDAAFIPEIDELLNHYSLAGPYARQIGESLASVSNGRIARTMVNASRVTTPPYTNGPLPGYYYDTNIKTDPSKLEEAAYSGLEHMKVYDIGGGLPNYFLPWQQYLLLARYTGIDSTDTSGSGNRSTGKVGLVAGLNVDGTNSIPNSNYTADTFAKYNGDFSTTVGIITKQMAVGTLKRRGMKVVMKEQEDRLGTLLIGSQLEGHDKLRPECAYEVASASR